METYQKQLVEAKAQPQIEQRNLARAEVKSPIDGVVLNRHQTRRQYLSAGTPLLTLGRAEDIEVIAEHSGGEKRGLLANAEATCRGSPIWTPPSLRASMMT